ncbi:hypothetical protein M427DRAFT_34925 [Gonapodya prolifera JEL478]|uniref:CHRD domain-containing protein n=1 Tax=Gonapodya prolifera (strain JEL478) TaxID=1344416 RepID=A0A139A635_GONPJ|nr:hypothetical protein M427DRAFT_34925 [Gonapodya prolifera JEL478]|eukprot:KXS12184.1 hypothetical protein M427DRAFT_34925 [Gonapodya prolifera JEL478]
MQTFQLFALLAASLLAGLSYAQNYSASLAGSNEVPPNNSPATGTCFAAAASDQSGTRYLYYNLSVINISNPVAAHFHYGPSGVSGPIIVPIFDLTVLATVPLINGSLVTEGFVTNDTIFNPDNMSPITTFASFASALSNGSIYINVHTRLSPNVPIQPGNIPTGEVRCQFPASANGTAATIPVTTMATTSATASSSTMSFLPISSTILSATESATGAATTTSPSTSTVAQTTASAPATTGSGGPPTLTEAPPGGTPTPVGAPAAAPTGAPGGPATA